MDENLQEFLEENPHYLNKSEAVRDALRHLLNSQHLADWAREDVRVSREQIAAGDTVAPDDLKSPRGLLSERARDRLTELERNIQRPIKEPRREITPEQNLSPFPAKTCSSFESVTTASSSIGTERTIRYTYYPPTIDRTFTTVSGRSVTKQQLASVRVKCAEYAAYPPQASENIIFIGELPLRLLHTATE